MVPVVELNGPNWKDSIASIGPLLADASVDKIRQAWLQEIGREVRKKVKGALDLK